MGQIDDAMNSLAALKAAQEGDVETAKTMLNKVLEGKNRTEICDIVYGTLNTGLKVLIQSLYNGHMDVVDETATGLYVYLDRAVFATRLRSLLGVELFESVFGENADVRIIWSVGKSPLREYYEGSIGKDLDEYLSKVVEEIRTLN